MIILHLTLKKHWYDMIASGEKKEEYREIKPHWNRILTHNIKIKGRYYHPTDVVIEFRNGYGKAVPRMQVECKGLVVREGKQEWGAEPNKQYHTFLLGEIITPQQ